jgi:small-conductance mechanosensitive channel
MVEAVLDLTFLGNAAWRWTTAIAIAVGTFIVLLLLRRVIRSRYARLAATPADELMEVPLQVAAQTTAWFLLILAIYGGAQALVLPPKGARLLLTAFTIATFWQVGLWATTAVVAGLERKQRRTLAVDRAAAGTFGILGFVARVTIWSFVLLLTLDNLGIEIKPLLAGLGIGGIAVALAAQNILGDLFASLSITLDRPFVIGDTLQVGDFIGTVEHIGVKSTRLKSVSGEQIIMPNSNLLASGVRNHTRATDRRVVFTISVEQTTPAAKVRRIPGMIRELIEAQPDVRFDRAHFAKISASSLDIEAVYIVSTTDFNRHMDILQEINLRLIEQFHEEQIEFGYPTQRLYFEQAAPVQSQLVTRESASEPRGPER